MKIQLMLSRILSFLGSGPSINETMQGGGGSSGGANPGDGVEVILPSNYTESFYYKSIRPVVNIINEMLLPIIIVLGALGGIYAIILAVKYSQAESGDKRGEVKKQMINGIIGIVVMLIVLILMKLLTHYADDIAIWIVGDATTA